MFAANACYVSMFLRASKKMHKAMLDAVVRSSLRFFESTPTGRILNRFSKDVEASEGAIPESIRELIYQLLAMLSVLVVICSATPFFLLALVPIAAMFILVQVLYISRRFSSLFYLFTLAYVSTCLFCSVFASCYKYTAIVYFIE